jgi:hypothetical protein
LARGGNGKHNAHGGNIYPALQHQERHQNRGGACNEGIYEIYGVQSLEHGISFMQLFFICMP